MPVGKKASYNEHRERAHEQTANNLTKNISERRREDRGTNRIATEYSASIQRGEIK